MLIAKKTKEAYMVFTPQALPRLERPIAKKDYSVAKATSSLLQAAINVLPFSQSFWAINQPIVRYSFFLVGMRF